MTDDPKYQTGDVPSPRELPEDVLVSTDTLRPDRLPPGQVRTRQWPVLHATTVPHIDLDAWHLDVTGLVQQPVVLRWNDFAALPRVQVFADFHCVTRWSRLGNLWQGVSVRTLLDRAGVQPEARFAVVTGYDQGWTTNLPLDDLLAEDALVADRHDGQPISADHGGPVRLIVPKLYAWKSAKWVQSIELVAEDQPGYWERAGYHRRGDPWREERYGR